MAAYTYGADIFADVLFRGGEPVSGSNYEAAVKRYIWRAYIELLKSGPRLSARKDPPGIIDTVAQVTGDASITKGSTALTLDASIATSMSGRKIKFDNEDVPYRITAHTGGDTAVTLDAAYKEDTVTSGDYTIFQDEYDLASDCLIPWEFWYRSHPANHITPESIDYVDRLNPSRLYSTADGPLKKVAMINEKKVRIIPWTEDARTIEYSYTIEPTELTYDSTATDIPIVELADRYLIADIALGFLLFDKNDERFNGLMGILNSVMAGSENLKALSRHSRMAPRKGRGLSG